MSIERSKDKSKASRTQGAEKQATSNNKIKILLTIITVTAGLIGTVLVGYWQFAYKHTPDQPKLVSFTGRVTDSINGKPIHKAKVSIEEDREIPQIEFTDSEGIFHLKLRQSTTSGRIRVESSGYKAFDRNISLSRTGIEEILLEPIDPPQSVDPTPTPAPASQPKKTPINPHDKQRGNAKAQSKTPEEKAMEELYSRSP